jgi:hypothetical protein
VLKGTHDKIEFTDRDAFEQHVRSEHKAKYPSVRKPEQGLLGRDLFRHYKTDRDELTWWRDWFEIHAEDRFQEQLPGETLSFWAFAPQARGQRSCWAVTSEGRFARVLIQYGTYVTFYTPAQVTFYTPAQVTYRP